MFWDDCKPSDFVLDTNSVKKYFVVGLLRSGKTVARNKGHFRCKMCGDRLGSCDVAGWGFIWPEGSEHYIEKHNIWIKEFDELLIEYENRNKTAVKVSTLGADHV